MPVELLTRAEFARRAGYQRSYVTRLGQQGRLVLSDDGRKVWLNASVAQIKSTKDPSRSSDQARAAAAKRHQPDAEPSTGAPIAPEAADSPAGASAASQADGDDVATPSGRYADWRVRSERAKALAAERDLAISLGDLLRSDDVRAAVSAAFTEARSRLECLPDQLAPVLAGLPSEQAVRMRLTDEFELVLEELSRQLKTASEAPSHA
jgi:hypothetical protein